MISYLIKPTQNNKWAEKIAEIFPSITKDGLIATVTITDDKTKSVSIRGISSTNSDTREPDEEIIAHTLFNAIRYGVGKSGCISGSALVENYETFKTLLSVKKVD